MWYASRMPTELPKADLRKATAARDHARSVRRVHRRRTERGDPQRETDLDLALERLRSAMAPLRRQIGKFPYGPESAVAEQNRAVIRTLSSELQAERRKLWKMKKRKED